MEVLAERFLLIALTISPSRHGDEQLILPALHANRQAIGRDVIARCDGTISNGLIGENPVKLPPVVALLKPLLRTHMSCEQDEE